MLSRKQVLRRARGPPTAQATQEPVVAVNSCPKGTAGLGPKANEGHYGFTLALLFVLGLRSLQ